MMKSILSFCKSLKKRSKLIAMLLALFPIFVNAQISKAFQHKPYPSHISRTVSPNTGSNYRNANGGLNTVMSSTCPASPVTMTGEDATTGATINSGHTFSCGANSFYILPGTVAMGAGIPSPCAGTEFNVFHTNIGTNGSETIIEGGVPIYTLCDTCAESIGGPIPFLNNGAIWSFSLYNLDPSQELDFVFCRTGNITTDTVSLIDCWTGAPLGISSVFSNTTATSGGTCDTMKILPGTVDLGTVSYSITPASGIPGLITFGQSFAAGIYMDTLGVGSYTVTYVFTPPASASCPPVTGTYKFKINSSPTVTVNSPSVCAGNTATLTAHVTGGTAPYTYSWTPGTNLSSTTTSVTASNPTVTTTYTVTGMAGGCSATATSTVTVVSATFSVNSLAICGGSTADTLTATGGATTYSWTPSTGLSATSGSTVTATPSVTTIYTVTGTNGVCSTTETSTVVITSSPVVTVNSATICAGTTTTLTAGGATTYTWSPATGLSATTGNTVTATPSVTTTYTVTGSAGTCTVVPDTSQVQVDPTVTLTVNSEAICTAGSATLTASGATTYSWSPSTGLSATTGSMVVANPTVTTTYTITGATGACSSTDTSVVSVYSIPTFSISGKDTLCANMAVNLIASDATLTYTWSPAATTTVSATTDTAMVSLTTSTVYTVTGANAACPSVTITDSLVVIASPTITVLSPTVCVGTTATITATGATSYTWSPMTNLTSSITNDTVYISNPLAPASYTVMGMAPNGCISSAVSQVDTSNHLGILSGTPVIACFGNAIALGALGASTYTWTTLNLQSANLDFGLDTGWAVNSTIANVGTYTVAIYGESHSGTYCNGYDTITVTVNPTPTVTATNSVTTICNGSSVVLTATTVPNGTLTVTYGWFPATGLTPPSTTANTVTASPSVTTAYLATAAYATGCSSNTSFTVNVIPVPAFTVNSAAYCIGNSDSLKVTATIPASTYSWNPLTDLTINANTQAALSNSTNTLTPTVYTITGTNTSGTLTCSSAATATVVVIPLPTVTVSPTYSICPGGTATLTAGGTAVSYTWNPATSPATGSVVMANPIANPSTYTVVGTDGNGCVNTAMTTVNIMPLPTASASVNNPICVGQDINLTANSTSGSPTYIWTGPGTYTSSTQNTTTTIPNSTTANNGTYSLVVIAGGCPSAPITVVVTVNNPPIVTVSPSTVNVCPGTAVTYTASGALTYDWTTLSSTNTGSVVTANPTTSGVYVITGTDVNGCSAPATVTVSVIQVVANMSATPDAGEAPLSVQFTNLSTGASSYVWNYGNGSSNQTTTNVATSTSTNYPNAGTYTVTLTASNTTNGTTCTDTYTLTILVTEGYSMVVPNVFTPNGDGLNEFFIVKAEGVSTFSLDIFDRWGLKVFSSSNVNTGWDGKTAGGKEMSEGTYFYLINATSSKTNVSTEYKGYLTLIR